MRGAKEYAMMFETGQYGRLYLVSGSHARGRTFHIFVLPAGVEAIPNGTSSPPLNKDAVEVYGITEGHPGWTEIYGWLHDGKWQEDFAALVKVRRTEIANHKVCLAEKNTNAMDAERRRNASLLATY